MKKIPKVQRRLQKSLPPELPSGGDSEEAENMRIGMAVRTLRERRGLMQSEVAAMAGIHPPRLSALEKGRHQPSLSTLRRICAALGATLEDLLRSAGGESGGTSGRYSGTEVDSASILPGLRDLFQTPEERLFSALTQKGFLRTTRTDSYATPLLPEEIVQRLEQRLGDYLRLEHLCGAFRRASIPLSHPFQPTIEGAEVLASWLRRELGLGDSIVLDYISLLENHGIRVIFLPLPRGVESLSFYEQTHESAFLIINDQTTPEKQLFRLALELAYIYLFTRNGCIAVHESAEVNRRFAKFFAACFLMPRTSILYAAASLGAGKGDWTYPLLLRVKRQFGVSAEAFTYRLLELGLLTDAAAAGLIASIRQHYQTHQNREPGMPLPPLLSNGRLCDLLERARSIPGVYDELQSIARHAEVPFSGN